MKKRKMMLSLILLNLLTIIGLYAQGTTIYCDDFETAALDLSYWDAQPNISGGAGIVELADGNGIDGSRGVCLGKISDGAFTTNALDLKLNLSGQTGVKLSFWIYDYNDETHTEDGIYFSDNAGISFTKVVDFNTDSWCDYQFNFFPIVDVSKLAGDHGLNLNSSFIIRFQQYDDGDFWGNPDGYCLDEICVYSQPPLYATLPFYDGFETGQLSDSWAWRFPENTNTLSSTPNKPSNWLGVNAGNGFNSEYGLVMGKTCDDGFTTNAIDLHLNLKDLTEVEMTFWIYDYNDETHADDGLYFSDNGGLNFEKVLDFHPDEWCDYQYGQLPPIDIDQLAAEHDLSLTETFIIRFQQHDDGDFWGNPDGFTLDDISVYVPDYTYFPLTSSNHFYDDFETGELGPNWAWRPADATATLVSNPSKPSNVAGVFDGSGWNGTYGVGIGKNCDDGFATNAIDLHLDLSNISEAKLTFMHYNIEDETQVDDGIYFSDNGGMTYTKVWDFLPSDWCSYVYSQHPHLDIRSLAEANGLSLSSQFIIRFQQHDDGDFWGSPDGFNMDNVHVFVPETEYATIPFQDDFETGHLGNAWSWSIADATALPAVGVTKPSNVIGVFNGVGNNSEYGVAMGKDCDDGFATNALDLHLKLAGTSGSSLSFDYYHLEEAFHIQDGIYFSDNGGQDFMKVFDFDFANNPAYTFQTQTLDIDLLAATNGLELSNQFVIRFQQHGDGDFWGSPDGLYLDNVSVNGIPSSTKEGSSIPNVDIYPNPATSNIIYIKGLPNGLTDYTFSISDINGRKLKHGYISSTNPMLNIEDLPSGLFVVEIRHEQKRAYCKLVKQ